MAAMLRSRQLAAAQLHRTPSSPGTSLAGISLKASLHLHDRPEPHLHHLLATWWCGRPESAAPRRQFYLSEAQILSRVDSSRRAKNANNSTRSTWICAVSEDASRRGHKTFSSEAPSAGNGIITSWYTARRGSHERRNPMPQAS